MKHYLKIQILPLIIFIGLYGGEIYGQKEDDLAAKADSLIYTGEWDNVITAYQELILRYGEKELYLRGRGYAYIQKGDLDKGESDYSKAIELNPKCSNCYLNIAMIALGRKQVEVFKKNINNAISHDPKNPAAYYQRADFEMNSGNYYAAIQDFTKTIELDDKDPRTFLMRSMCYSAIENTEAAYKDINKTIELKPDVEYAYFVRAKIFIQINQPSAAIDDLNKCINKNKSMAEYYTHRAYVYYSIGENLEAINDYSSAINISPNDYINYLNRSYVHANALNFAASCLDKEKTLELLPSHEIDIKNQIGLEISNYCDASKPTFYYNQIDIALNNQKYDIANSIIREATNKYKNNPILYHYKASILIMKRDYLNALVELKQAYKNVKKLAQEKEYASQRKLSIEEFASIFEATICESMSFANASLSNFEAAIKNINLAISVLEKATPTVNIKEIESQAYVKSSTLLVSVLKIEEAKKALELGLKANSKNTDCHTSLANILILEASNVFKNIEKDQIKAVSPKEIDSLFTTAQHDKKAVNSDLLEKAISECDKALKINPYDKMAYYYRASATILLGKSNYCQDAKFAYQLGINNIYQLLGVSCD